jgi:hypothetical protein
MENIKMKDEKIVILEKINKIFILVNQSLIDFERN